MARADRQRGFPPLISGGPIEAPCRLSHHWADAFPPLISGGPIEAESLLMLAGPRRPSFRR